jgi:hypothetical protein
VIKQLKVRAVRARLLLALGIALVGNGAAFGQTAIGPRPLPPPTYPGAVPLSVLGYESSLYSSGFVFTFTVDIAEIQKFLPTGYTPVTTDGTTGFVTAIFGYQSLLTLNQQVGDFAPGTYGPFETFDLAVSCLTPPGSAVGFETVFIARLVNNAEIADIANTLTGAASVRVADIEVRANEGLDVLRMKGKVEDPEFGLKIAAALTGPAEIASQLRHGTFITGVPSLGVRSVDTTVSPPTLHALTFFTGSADLTAQLTDPAALSVTESRVRLAGGSMRVLGITAGSFYLNQENLYKKSPF